MSNGKPLESGGMIYTEASQNGRKLKLAPDKNITVKMPSKDPKKGMTLFYGEFTKDKKLNWVDTKVPFRNSNLRIGVFKTMFKNNEPLCLKCGERTPAFIYPPLALEKRISGSVQLYATITKEGQLSNIKFKTKLGYGIEDSIENSLKKTGEWIPIFENYQSFDQKLLFYFTFDIDKDGKGIIGYPKVNNLQNYREWYDSSFVKRQIPWYLAHKKEMNSPKLVNQEVWFDDDTIYYDGNSNSNQYYISSILKLGWANCDQFYQDKVKTNLIVYDDTLSTLLICDNRKTIMNGEWTKETHKGSVFKSVPIDEPVTLLSFIEKEKRINYCLKKIKITTNLEMKMDNYQMVNKQDFERIISSIK